MRRPLENGQYPTVAWVRWVVTAIRWWFGVTYLLGGVGGVVAGPVMIALGNWGGVYMIIGGGIIAGAGWWIVPWRPASMGTA